MQTIALEFSDRLSDLLRKEQHAMADFLLSLAEFDRMRLWVELGHKTLFLYLTKRLGLSPGAASFRVAAVEVIQNFPAVEAALREGKLCLTTSYALSRVLTPENVEEVLPRFFGLSRREAMELAARLAPAPVVPERTVVIPLRENRSVALPVAPEPRVTAALAPLLAMAPEAPAACTPTSTLPPAPVRAFESPARAEVRPLTAERSRIHVTVDAGFHARLEEARAALSHSHPAASDGDILELALVALLERNAKRKGIGTRQLKTPRPSKREHVPAHVLAAALERAGHCCEWKVVGGGVCGSRWQLQPDHIVPVALGGKSDLSNIRIACRFHNLLAAREVFGDACMDRYTKNPRAVAGGRAGRSAVPSADAPDPVLL
jgi:hypothetical protein